jgi:hypothetical protein
MPKNTSEEMKINYAHNTSEEVKTNYAQKYFPRNKN